LAEGDGPHSIRGVKQFLKLPFVCLAILLIALPARSATFDEEDFKMARKKAEQGDADAAFALGMMYYTGEGTPQNHDEAVKWYRRAAAKGNAYAQNSLGVMYLNGYGVQKNLPEAAKWIRASANQGNPQAQLNLGHLLADGRGIPRNLPEAAKWYHRAAEQGDAEAQVNLGRCYVTGEIVGKKHLVTAYKWFLLAAAQGDPKGSTERDELTKQLTKPQIAEAQKLAVAFTPRQDPSQATSPKATGTGFLITKEGHLLTAYHVIEDSTNIVARTKRMRFATRLINADRTNDIALLKIIGAYALTPTNAPGRPAATPSRLLGVTSNFRPLTVTPDEQARLGDAVSTIGFPNVQIQGREPKFTRGEINSLAGIKDDERYFQISAPVQPGNSGGPLLDKSGRVIGMVLSRLNDITLLKSTGSVPQNVNYALKSSRLLTLLKSLPPAPSSFTTNAMAEVSSDWLTNASDSILLLEVF
jgi:V8-like Glu-specific endopeptidase